jgi:DNA-binding PadR family transcriptional regulator
MDVELMTLGYLNSGPKTGYKLNQIFGNLMLYYAISLNQIYPVLRNLESCGLVEKEVVFQVGKPNKNVYSITPEGQRFLEEKLTAAPEPLDYHLPFLVRLLFFRFLEQEKACAEFEKEIASLREQAETLRDMEHTVNQRADADGAFAYRTALHLLESLASWYEAELERRRKEPEHGCENR